MRARASIARMSGLFSLDSPSAARGLALAFALLVSCRRGDGGAAAAASVASVAVPPPSAVPSAREPSGTVKLGQTATLPELQFAARRLLRCPKGPITPAAGRMHLGVELHVTGVGNGLARWEPWNTVAVRDGTRTLHRPVLANCTPLLRASALGEGATASGWLVFELPEDANGLTLELALDGKRPILTVALGR